MSEVLRAHLFIHHGLWSRGGKKAAAISALLRSLCMKYLLAFLRLKKMSPLSTGMRSLRASDLRLIKKLARPLPAR